MKFSQKVWEHNKELYQKTLNHPFNQELAKGTLTKEAFKQYVIQDAHYLVSYGRALAITGAKAPEAEQIVQFTKAAQTAIMVERTLHDGFMANFGISQDEFEQTPKTMACDHYTLFLLATAWSESYPVALAALLPCYWIYGEVGKDIYNSSVPNNPYQAWIDTYAGEEFQHEVAEVIRVIDAVAAKVDQDTLDRMYAAYKRAAELELIFWDSAYHTENWSSVLS